MRAVKSVSGPGVWRLVGIGMLALAGGARAGENETNWRGSIEAGIRQGMPAADLCVKARSSAYASSEPAFVDWATRMARRYCRPDEMGRPEAVPTSAGAASAPAAKAPAATGAAAPKGDTGAGCQMVINNWRPARCGDGPNLQLGP